MSMPWQPPLPPPSYHPPAPGARKSGLIAAMVGSALLIAGGLVAGALILNNKSGAAQSPATCQSWSETRQVLRSVPMLPAGWNFNTAGIDTVITNRNALIGTVVDLFDAKIQPAPPEVAQAAKAYVAAQRLQMQALTDRSYVPADGAAVDAALQRLDQVCGLRGATAG